MPKIVSNPHDRFFLASMSHLGVAKEFFETYLPEEIRQLANLSTLQLQKESFVDEALKSKAWLGILGMCLKHAYER